MTSLGSELGSRLHTDDAPVLRVAVVCRGNVARSPLGAAALDLAARRHDDRAALAVTSAGLGAREGHCAAPRSIRVAARHGVDLRGHLSTHVTNVDLDEQDVVLTMTRTQRDALHGQLRPDAVFTYLELAHLLGELPPSCSVCHGRPQVARALEQAAALRPFVKTDPMDVDDPMGRGRRAYRKVWRQLSTAADVICGTLMGEPSDDCAACRGRNAIDTRWSNA